MLPHEIHLYDIYRILVGNAPWSYFIELLIRCIICYAILVIAIRLMGKRMAAKMSRNELASMVLMAAAIGIPVASPDRGIVPGIIIAIIIVFGERFISSKISKNDKIERAIIGDIRVMVSDGYIVINNISANRLSRDRIFAELRSQSLKHLGQVKRFYFESDGSFTLIKDKEKKTGLCILPDFDKALLEEQKNAAQQVCAYCGKEDDKAAAEKRPCSNCGLMHYVQAIEE